MNLCWFEITIRFFEGYFGAAAGAIVLEAVAAMAIVGLPSPVPVEDLAIDLVLAELVPSSVFDL